MQTIKEHISRIRSSFKINTEDNRVTDRTIYLLMRKHRDFVVKRDKMAKMIYQDNLFQEVSFKRLTEVDSVEACNIQTDCKIKRTKFKLPSLVENDYGVIIRWVGSLDRSQDIKPITASAWARKQKKTTAKFSNELYYWYMNGYLYFPNLEWDAIRIEGFFEDEVQSECGDCDKDSSEVPCKRKQNEVFRIPDYLVSSMDQMIGQDLSIHAQLTLDHFINKNENIK